MKILIIDTKNKIMLFRSGFFIKKVWVEHDVSICLIKRKIEDYSKKGFIISFSDLSEFKMTKKDTK